MTFRVTRTSFSVVVDLDSAGLDADGDLAFSFYIRVAVAGQMYILDKNTALAAVQVMVIPKPYLRTYYQVTFSCGQTARDVWQSDHQLGAVVQIDFTVDHLYYIGGGYSR